MRLKVPQRTIATYFYHHFFLQQFHAKNYGSVLRTLGSCGSHILQGGQETQSSQCSVVDGQHIWKSYHNGGYKANSRGAFCNQKLDLCLTLNKGSFLPAIKDFSSKRGLATQGDFDIEDLSEIDSIDMSVSDSGGIDVFVSDEDTIEKTAGKQPQKQQKIPSLAQCRNSDEDEDYDKIILNEELTDSSPLDVASENIMEETCDQRRPLWMRLEESSAGKKASLLKDVFDEWTAEGNTLSRAMIISTMTILRKRRKYWRALEVSDWIMRERPFELTGMDYGIRVELIAKLQGANKAADYFATIPKIFQTSMAYSILLTAYVEQDKEKEARNLLLKVKKLGLGDDRTYMYNQLLYLYKKNGLMAGIAEMLKTIEEENVEPDIFTYNIILDIRARKGDVKGMEMVWAHIKENKNVEPDAATFSILAKGYLTAGLPEKAEKMAQRIEHSPFRKRRIVILLLLKLYGNLGKEDQLERIWGLVTGGPRVGNADYVAMIRALGKVGNSARAEDIFEEMEEKVDNLTVHHYNALLSVYASLGRTQKGESLLKRLARAKLHPNPGTYHELVVMYLKAGQEHKAMEVLSTAQKASRSSIRRRPMYSTFQVALEWLAEKGNVKTAEKVVRDLKSAGYLCSYRSYLVLLKAYENGRTSPYGFLDRLQADNIIPNQLIRKQLKMLDGT